MFHSSARARFAWAGLLLGLLLMAACKDDAPAGGEQEAPVDGGADGTGGDVGSSDADAAADASPSDTDQSDQADLDEDAPDGDGTADLPPADGMTDRGDAACQVNGLPCDGDDECCSGVCNVDGLCAEALGTCSPAGGVCTSGATCCSGRCDRTLGECLPGTGGCTEAGGSCHAAVDCCSLYCVDGECETEGVCASEGDDCSVDADCCTDICDEEAGTCAEVAGCLSAGERCELGEGGSNACCSRACVQFAGELRCITGGVCRTSGEVCQRDSDCCTEICLDLVGNDCDAGDDCFCAGLEGGGHSCRIVGEPCSRPQDCCSYACFDDGTGFRSCQFLGGCRPIGELCTDDWQCCSNFEDCNNATLSVCELRVEWGADVVCTDTCATASNLSCEDGDAGSVDDSCDFGTDCSDCGLRFQGGFGRCGHPTGPKPAGEVCQTEDDPNPLPGSHDCCGGDEACQPSTLGIPRCVGGDFDDCIENDQPCATSAQCCSGLCAPDDDGHLICQSGACLPVGDSCTIDGECCTGACSGEGACCAVDGVACSDASQCCSDYCDPLTAECADCLTDGNVCSSDGDCCQGNCVGEEVDGSGVCGPAECVPLGESCAGGGTCCAGDCIDDICVSCAVVGQECSEGADCCSGICDDALGECAVCLSNGNTCGEDAECCSAYCDPELSECAAPPVECLELGETCGSNLECCSGLCEGGVCTQACLPLDAPCTANADCCSEFCYGIKDSVCADPISECGAAGTTCSTDADCCEGLACGEGSTCEVVVSGGG